MAVIDYRVTTRGAIKLLAEVSDENERLMALLQRLRAFVPEPERALIDDAIGDDPLFTTTEAA